MIIYTYRSVRVSRILKSGEIYRAHPSQKYGRVYDCLIDILRLRCECLIFGNPKFHRKNTGGSISSNIKLILRVPKENVWLTECSEWAGFMYMVQFTSPKDYYDLITGEVDGITREKLYKTTESLKLQRGPWAYRVPQTVLEGVRLEWLARYRVKLQQTEIICITLRAMKLLQPSLSYKINDYGEEERSMDKKLSFSSYLLVGPVLFGLFFEAGNLTFPVHMSQMTGASTPLTTIGFLITAIGLPFFGVIAVEVSGSLGLSDLAGRMHPVYRYMMTTLLYITIGPLFALPHTATVPFEIGLVPFLPQPIQRVGLAVFTVVFFVTTLVFSLRPNRLLIWVGKVLNPLFLAMLTALIILSIVSPMGAISQIPIAEPYATSPFFKSSLEGHNTMDALASLALGIIMVNNLKELDVGSPHGVALVIIRSDAINVLLMGLIYTFLAYMGVSSAGQFTVSENGGIVLAQIARRCLRTGGSVLLAVIVTVVCLKTTIGLITAYSQTFCEPSPNHLDYRIYTAFFMLVSLLVASIDLTQIISLSIPVLIFLYPLAISLILLGVLSPLFHSRRCVYLIPIIFTLFAGVDDFLSALPQQVTARPAIRAILDFYRGSLPFFSLGMGWVAPLAAELVPGSVVYQFTKQKGSSQST